MDSRVVTVEGNTPLSWPTLYIRDKNSNLKQNPN